MSLTELANLESLILRSKELLSLFRDGSSCLEGILGGNHQFARAKIIAVGQCTDAAIDGFHIVLLVEKVSKLCRKAELFQSPNCRGIAKKGV